MYRVLWLMPAVLIIAVVAYLGFAGVRVNVTTIKKEVPASQFLS